MATAKASQNQKPLWTSLMGRGVQGVEPSSIAFSGQKQEIELKVEHGTQHHSLLAKVLALLCMSHDPIWSPILVPVAPLPISLPEFGLGMQWMSA